MAIRAESDQILIAVVTHVTSKLDVVNLKLCSSPTELTAPVIAPQNLLAKSFVQLRLEASSQSFWEFLIHGTVWICCRICCRSSHESISTRR